jgi:hypothetical protein
MRAGAARNLSSAELATESKEREVAALGKKSH